MITIAVKKVENAAKPSLEVTGTKLASARDCVNAGRRNPALVNVQLEKNAVRSSRIKVGPFLESVAMAVTAGVPVTIISVSMKVDSVPSKVQDENSLKSASALTNATAGESALKASALQTMGYAVRPSLEITIPSLEIARGSANAGRRNPALVNVQMETNAVRSSRMKVGPFPESVAMAVTAGDALVGTVVNG